MMGKIFYVMGKSSSGKDTIYQRLMKEYRFQTVVLYTTRPKRDSECDGREYHFVTEADLRRLQDAGKVIEVRAYHTVHGIWYYFTVDDGQLDAARGDYLLLGTLESYQKMREYYGGENFVPLYIEVEDGLRLERALKREQQQKEPKYAELCRRYLADEKDFAEENLRACGIEKRYLNINLEECLSEIRTDINRFRVKTIRKDYGLRSVQVTDAYRKNALEKELSYLRSLDADRLMAGFYETRGLTPRKIRYGGWESLDIKGHTLGHFITALVQAFEETGNAELSEKLAYMMAELKKCQHENGYLSAFPEEQFDRLERKEEAWVPWYTLHKILAGITAVYQITGNTDAGEIMTALADWVAGRVNWWDEAMQKQILAVEYGGMNDAMYEVYKISGREEHLKAAHQFDEMELFTEIRAGHDVLNDKHANTTIPKFLGAVNRYLVTGEEFYLQAAESFFTIVEKHHTYITGGNSEWEHFGLPDVLDRERTNCNCETCNTHNMLKLADRLYQITGKKRYADFYENTLINAILSSQNPETGMAMYFQPMATGYFKVFSRPYENFWCCTGTGMENFTKLHDAVYYKDLTKKNIIYVNQYVGSMLRAEEAGILLIQETDIPLSDKVRFVIRLLQTEPEELHCGAGKQNAETSVSDTPMCRRVTLCFRMPFWLDGAAELQKNGKVCKAKVQEGYLVWGDEFADGDEMMLHLPMRVGYETLPDNPQAVAFRYGPVVLSAALGIADMEEEPVGVDVMTPVKTEGVNERIKVKGTVDEWLHELPAHLVRQGDTLEFRLCGTDRDEELVFRPHYSQYRERYGIYFILVQTDSCPSAK